jgi:hypothetical protein
LQAAACKESLQILVDQLAERAGTGHLGEEGAGVHPQCGARHLRDRPHGERAAGDEGHPDDALVANRGHLDDGTVVQGRDQRDDAVQGKVDGPDRLARLEQDGLDRQRHRDHVGDETVAVLRGQGPEDSVGVKPVRAVEGCHRNLSGAGFTAASAPRWALAAGEARI